MVIILSVGLITPLVTLMSYSDDIRTMGTIFGEVRSILDAPEMTRPAEGNVPVKNDLELKDVHFSYQISDSAAEDGKKAENAAAAAKAGNEPVAGDDPISAYDRVSADNPPAADSEVLHGVSMKIPEGSFVALVGPSGSGKSPLGCDCGFDHPGRRGYPQDPSGSLCRQDRLRLTGQLSLQYDGPGKHPAGQAFRHG